MEIPSLAGKCPETLPDFALKREHLPQSWALGQSFLGKQLPIWSTVPERCQWCMRISEELSVGPLHVLLMQERY